MGSGLTFDWDGVSIEDELVNVELEELFDFFGEGKVWYRISSSGKGIHVMIADMYYEPTTNQVLLKPIPLDSKTQMDFRRKSLLGMDYEPQEYLLLKMALSHQSGNLTTHKKF